MASRSEKAEKKNQPQEIPDGVRGGPDEPTTGLRDAALRLNRPAPIGGRGLHVDRLLGGLQAGKLRAGAFFLSEPMLWIDMPASYWTSVSTQSFKRIRDTGDGGYMIRLREFSELIVGELIAAAPTKDLTAARDKLVIALKNANKRVEVKLVLDKKWDDYVSSLVDENDRNSIHTKRGGRPELPEWKTVGLVMTAYFVSEEIRSRGEMPQAKIAEAVLKKATELNLGTKGLPRLAAIEDQVSDTFGMIERFEKT